MFFTHFASNDQLPSFSMLRTLAGNRLTTVTSRRNIIWVNELNQVFNGLGNTKPLVFISTDQILIYENFTGFILNFWMCLQLHDAVIICTVAICWCFSKIGDVCYIDLEKRDMIRKWSETIFDPVVYVGCSNLDGMMRRYEMVSVLHFWVRN